MLVWAFQVQRQRQSLSQHLLSLSLFSPPTHQLTTIVLVVKHKRSLRNITNSPFFGCTELDLIRAMLAEDIAKSAEALFSSVGLLNARPPRLELCNWYEPLLLPLDHIRFAH